MNSRGITESIYLFIVIFGHLFSFIHLFFFGRYIGRFYLVLVSYYYNSLVVIASIWVFIKQFLMTSFSGGLEPIVFIHVSYTSWIASDLDVVNWEFSFTKINLLMLITVSLISLAVQFYSLDYMKTDPSLNRFIAYLALFTFFMTVFITSSNIIILFLGWEGIGFRSFLLIGFWSTRKKAVRASVKALLLNRLGDFFILMAACISLHYLKTADITLINFLAPYLRNCSLGQSEISVIDSISICLIVGASIKSAQLGVHLWLPDAMEGPTPVSALIHAATMVTAGVLLIIKFSILINLSDITLTILSLMGALTALLSGFMALSQWDLKKIIAFSTCSQLGYMILACGLSLYSIGFFHLIVHAFSKAALFLIAGNVIHNAGGEQDIRKIKFVDKSSHLSLILFLVANLSLCGILYFSGFYSKDLIIHNLYIKADQSIFNFMLFFAIILSALITTCYSARVFYYVFYEKFNFSRSLMFLNNSSLENISNKFKIGPFAHSVKSVIFLSSLSIFSGFLLNSIFIAYNGFFCTENISKNNNDISVFSEFVSSDIDPFVVMLTYCVFFIWLKQIKEFDIVKIIFTDYYYYFYSNFRYINKKFDSFVDKSRKNSEKLTYGGGYPIVNFFNNICGSKFYFDALFVYVSKHLSTFCLIVYAIVDKGSTILLINGLAKNLYNLAFNIDKVQTGKLHHYLSVFLCTLLLFIFLLFL